MTMGTAIHVDTSRTSAPRNRGGTSVGNGAQARRLARRHHRRDGRTNADKLASTLGWFSIGLGLAQVVAPGGVARLCGLQDDSRSRSLMRTLGLRELTSGLGILSQPQSPGWVWSRVAGDMIDLSMLGKALASTENDRGRTAAAATAVLGVTALDVMCAQRLSSSVGLDEGAEEEGKIHVVKAITIHRPVEEIYGYWRNLENLPRFMTNLVSVTVTGEGRSHWIAEGPMGAIVEWDSEVTADVPNEMIAWRSVEEADIHHSGTVRFRAGPAGRGSEVAVELDYDPPGGKLGAVVAKLFRKEPGQQVNDDLRRFKQIMELGEVVRSDASIHAHPHPAQPAE
jgi:uncharacterized membrane protein